jgi:hypothetical protein
MRGAIVGAHGAVSLRHAALILRFALP